MGGRGSSSGISAKSKGKDSIKAFDKKSEIAQKESSKKMATSGKKVQENFIDYVKQQTNINLNSARDKQFDKRNFFNVDTRKLGKNDLSTLKTFTNQYPGGYNVRFETNGAHRMAIFVNRK